MKAQMDAVHKAYETVEEDGTRGHLLPLLLYHGLDTTTYDPWKLTDPERCEQAYQDLLKAKKWDET